MKVKDAMHKGVDWVSPDIPVTELAKLMCEHDIGAIPIGENDRLIGMVTDRGDGALALRQRPLTVRRVASSPQLGSWIENVEKNDQFFVFLFSTVVICMGLTRWLGKRLWYREQISRRKELKLPVPSLLSSDPSSFNYSTLRGE